MNNHDQQDLSFLRFCDASVFFLCAVCIYADSRLRLELPSPQGLVELVQRWLTA